MLDWVSKRKWAIIKKSVEYEKLICQCLHNSDKVNDIELVID